MLATPASPTPSLWRRLGFAVPAGTVALALGFAANGSTVFAFLLLPRLTHRLDGASLSAFQALWFVVFLVTPGIFGPLEQATSARVAARRARGSSDRDAIRTAGRTTVHLCAFVSVAAAGMSPLLVTRAFEHDRSFVAWLVVALVGNGGLFFVEGIVSGRRRFGRYAQLIAFEGAVRLLGCIALVLANVHDASGYGALVALTPWVTICFACFRDPDLIASVRNVAPPGRHSPARVTERVQVRLAEMFTRDAGRKSPWAGDIAIRLDTREHRDGAMLTWRSGEMQFKQTVFHLLGSQLALQALINIAPIAATLLARPIDKPTVADFGTLFIVCRIPLFLYQALAITLLTELSGLAATGKHAHLRKVTTRIVGGISAVGAIGMGALVVAARPLGRSLLGPTTEISQRDWLLVGGANIIGMVALTVAVALVAQGRIASSGIGWTIGFVVAALFIAVTVGSRSIVDRVTMSYGIGMLAATGALISFALAPTPSRHKYS